jgi:lipopolysaccharide transport system permease protein
MQVEERPTISVEASQMEASRPTKIIRPVSFSASALFEGIAELLRYRDLLYTLTLHRIKVRYKQSVLGIGWAVFQPLALMLVYTIIFSLFIRFPTGSGHYSLFVLAGLAPWNFFQTSLSSAASGLVTHTQLITKVYFPREIIPLSYVLASFVDFVISCVILVAMMSWYHVGTTSNALYLVPIMLIGFAFTAGISFLISSVQVRFRDIGLAMPLILQLWMFGSPVVYSFSNVPRRFRSLYALNPMTGIIENFRRVLIEGVGADLRLLSISAVFAFITVSATYLYFKYQESTMADII